MSSFEREVKVVMKKLCFLILVGLLLNIVLADIAPGKNLPKLHQAIIDGDEKRVDQLLQTHVTIQSGSFTDFIASLSAELEERAAG